ncbi:hypothetical protein E4P82_09945 [Candidatus Competibacter phosphatis]|uniref:Uncharacterized protein n=1 Tax=Candidatus Competibacter phosphatis TaxID=221280 RepID=A0ABX1TM31_9GAMM|nr:hypothetical protein [Candidatus Competibacter phosphatis]NMQ19490.1 hypothetical protein [Candidatus Competibacter phosphatis]
MQHGFLTLPPHSAPPPTATPAEPTIATTEPATSAHPLEILGPFGTPGAGVVIPVKSAPLR